MHIHFVCRGNSFRSRLAEAYARSKIQSDEISFSSSGIEANRNQNGPISWYAMRIIKENGIVPYMSNYWTQTTQALLNQSDKIIFMKKNHLDFCRSNLNYKGENFEIWDIKDLVDSEEYKKTREEPNKDLISMKITEMIFEQIKEKVENLTFVINK